MPAVNPVFNPRKLIPLFNLSQCARTFQVASNRSLIQTAKILKISLKSPEIQLTASSSQVMTPELSCMTSLGSAFLKIGFIQSGLYRVVGRGLQIASASHILSTS